MSARLRRALRDGLVALLFGVVAFILLTAMGGKDKPKPQPSLVERIHTACRGNETLYDWRVEEGKLQVWCYNERYAFPLAIRVVTVQR